MLSASSLVNLDPPCLATGMSEISTTKVRGPMLNDGSNAETVTAELDDDALSDGGEELTEEQERTSPLLWPTRALVIYRIQCK